MLPADRRPDLYPEFTRSSRPFATLSPIGVVVETDDARHSIPFPFPARTGARRKPGESFRPAAVFFSREAPGVRSGLRTDETLVRNETPEEEAPMFAVIRHYHFKPEDGATIDRMVRDDFVPLIKKANGFIRYYWLDTGNGEGASVGVFRDRAGADESIRLAADYVKEHLSKYINQKPEIIEGEIKAHD